MSPVALARDLAKHDQLSEVLALRRVLADAEPAQGNLIQLAETHLRLRQLAEAANRLKEGKHLIEALPHHRRDEVDAINQSTDYLHNARRQPSSLEVEKP